MKPNALSQFPDKRKKLIAFLVGLAAFSLIIYLGGSRAIRAVFQPGYFFLLLCFFAHLGFLLLQAIRWKYIAAKIRGIKSRSLRDYLKYYIYSMFGGQFISRIGGDFLLRPLFLKKIDPAVTFSKAVAVIFLEKVADLIFVILGIVPALLYLSAILTGRQAALLALAIFLIGFWSLVFRIHPLVSCLQRVLRWIHGRGRAFPLLSRFARDSHLEKIEKISQSELIRKKSIFFLLFTTGCKYIILGLRLYWLARALNLPIPWTTLMAGLPVVQVSLIIAFTPGALGFREGGWYAVLGMRGLPRLAITTFLIGQRAYLFIFTSGIFLVVYVAINLHRLFSRRREPNGIP